MRSLAVAAAVAAAATALAAGLAARSAPAAAPEVASEEVAYEQGGEKLAGTLFYDPARKDPRPGVAVVHEWWGLGEHPKRKAAELAKLGYVAFCVDMYGTGKVTSDPKQAGQWAGRFREDRALGRARALAGLEVLRRSPRVDPRRLAAMGFCFGGTVSLEMAWSGADLKGVVSFHGNPTVPAPEEAAGVKAAVLFCHGADDGFVPDAAMAEFEKAMRDGKRDWTLVKYGGAVHSFTNPDADAHGIAGVKYQAAADRRSWEHMKSFLRELFGE